MSFQPPDSLGFQQLFVDAETKFSKEPLHSFITTEIPQGECNLRKPTQSTEKESKTQNKRANKQQQAKKYNKQTNERKNKQANKQEKKARKNERMIERANKQTPKHPKEKSTKLKKN